MNYLNIILVQAHFKNEIIFIVFFIFSCELFNYTICDHSLQIAEFFCELLNVILVQAYCKN